MRKSKDQDPKAADRRLVRTGLIGSLVAALCCFTPLLVVALGSLGLTAWLAWSDFVLLPALAVFLGTAGYGLWRLKSN